MKTGDITDELFLLAQLDMLPDDFHDWDIANGYGWTVAHEAAKYNHLPHSFNQWKLKDNYGYTVADVARKYDNLPKNYKV